MPLQVKLYGDLKEKVQQQSTNIGDPTIVILDDERIKKVLDVLEKLFIEENEISHIFVNSQFINSQIYCPHTIVAKILYSSIMINEIDTTIRLMNGLSNIIVGD